MAVDYETYLGQRVTVQIDRPLGSPHPIHRFIYPINYGFIPDTYAEDGEEIDVYVLDATEPLKQAAVTIIAIAYRNNDVENKLIGTIDGSRSSYKTIQAAIQFQEQFFDTVIRLHPIS